MPYSYEEDDDNNNDLHECCVIDCDKPATELLIMKSWTGNKYGGNESQTNPPVTSGYYCKSHMAKKLKSLTRRYRPRNTDDGRTFPATDGVNLAATSPKQ